MPHSPHGIAWTRLTAGLLACLLVLSSCTGNREPLPPGATADLNLLRGKMQESYRLKPDRRLLLAVNELQKMLAGPTVAPVQANFQNGQWVITSGTRTVGTLPELPGFFDIEKLLKQVATDLLNSNTIERKDSKEKTDSPISFDAAGALASLGTANQKWKNGDKFTAAREGAKALAVMAFLQETEMETGDEIQARALAALAIAQAIGAETNESACLLARSMGYCKEAASLAATLPPKDPIRSFCEKSAKEMLAMCESSENKDWTLRYLALRRLAELGDYDGWYQARSRWFRQLPAASVAVLQSGLYLHHFETDLGLANEMLDLLSSTDSRQFRALDSLPEHSYFDSVSDMVRGELTKKIALLNSEITRQSKGEGLYVNAETVRAFYGSSRDSALYLMGLHYLNKQSPSGAAPEFQRTIAQFPKWSIAEIARWYEPLSQDKAGHGSFTSLMETIEPANPFPAHALVQSLKELLTYANYRDPPGQFAAKAAFACLDSRPHHRRHAGDIAYQQCLNLPLASKLYSSAIAIGWPKMEFDIVPWYAARSGDPAALNELLSDRKLRPEHKIHVLKLLHQLKTRDSTFITKWYQKLLSSYPDNWELTRSFDKYLDEIGEEQQARDVLENWIATERTAGSLQHIQAVSQLATISCKLNQPVAAATLLAPIEDSTLLEVLTARALVLDKNGETAQAIKCAQIALSLYPQDKDACATMASLCWRHEKYTEAASALAAFLPGITLQNLDAIQESFVQCFTNNPDGGMRAFQALQDAHAGNKLFYNALAAGADAAGVPQLAFEIARKNMDNLSQDSVLPYEYLKHWKGKEQALSWLKSQLPQQRDWVDLAQTAYELGQYELLWDLIPMDANDTVWFIRAVADVAESNHSHQAELRKYFSKPGSSQSGRCLVGLVPESAMFHPDNNSEAVCRSAYVLALKADQRGDEAAATDWYRLVMERGETAQSEYRWSYYALLKKHDDGKFGQLPLR